MGGARSTTTIKIIVGLDPQSSFLLKETMRKQCAKGKTVFFSTYVMEVAERLCDRVEIIRRPHLTWNHPQQAVKQNLNVLIGMGIAIVAVGMAVVAASVVSRSPGIENPATSPAT